MRKLEKKEVEITKKSVKRISKEINDLTQSLEYNQDVLELNKSKRDHDFKWIKYLSDKRTEEEEETLKGLIEEIEMRRKNLKILKKQLNEGVEMPIPTGVN